MMGTRRSWILGALVIVATSGCALNALRVEGASDVATKGRVAVAGAREELARIAAQRTQLNIDYIGLDAACAPGQANLRGRPLVDPKLPIQAQRRGWLCSAQPITQPIEDGTVPLALEPPGEQVEPALLMLDAVGQYVGAIATIVEEKRPAAADDFTDSVALLHSAEALVRAGTGSKRSTVIPEKTDARVASITGLIAFIQKLQDEKTQVADLRQLVAHDDSAGQVIRQARDILNDWEAAGGGDASNRTAVALYLLQKSLTASQPPAPDIRRQLARDYYARAEAAADGARLKGAMVATFDALVTANNDLRDKLREHPDLSREDRARLARLTRQRVTAAFDALTAIITSVAKG